VRSVFVIDDDDQIRESLCELLQDEGIPVLCASDGQDAVGLLTGMDPLPGLVLLDLMMPIMNGWQFLEYRVGHPRLMSVPVAVLSATPASATDGARMAALGVVEWLGKPIGVNALLALIHRHCGPKGEPSSLPQQPDVPCGDSDQPAR
jgi:CheY-like chemotaxis protein